MEYDENLFKAKANRRARNIWLVFSLLLTANYGADVANGLNTPIYYLMFLLLCWVPFLSGQILMKVKGADTDLYRYDLGDRLWHFLSLCYLYYRVTDRLYLCPSGDQPFSTV